MNALPVGPEQVATDETRTRYFDNLEKWGFDIACNTFDAQDYEDVVGKLHEPYAEFVKEARRRGCPASIRVNCAVSAGDRVGIEEAQYGSDDEPLRCGESAFIASFASEAWREYLEEITSFFVRRCGYSQVIFDEPVWRTDIPGAKDRLRAKFAEAFPGVRYPHSRAELKEYLLLQQLKSDTLIDFYAKLVANAKSLGAKRVGIAPSTFAPSTENTPDATLSPSCDIGGLARIPGVDFIVSRMQPGHILGGIMRTGDDMAKSPMLYFTELLAQGAGTDLIAMSDTADRKSGKSPKPVPADFFRDATLASLAAAPKGFCVPCYGKDGCDEAYMEVLSKAMQCASRLGQPAAPVAFVFSGSGTRHAGPLTNETVFQHYWALAKQLAFVSKLPMLTFHADTLDRDLVDHPEVKVLVFEEHFPLTVDQILALRKWWQGDIRRAAIAFGSGLGFSADPEFPGEVPCGEAYPGLLELIGLRWEEEPQIESDAPIALTDVSRVRRKAFLSGQKMLDLKKIANVRRVFGSRATVLYEAEAGGTTIPVVTEYRDRTTLAVFCGFGLDHESAPAAEKAIRFAMAEMDCPPLVVESCSEGVVWMSNKHDYVIIVNLSDKEGQAVINPGRSTLWDCLEQKMIDEPKSKMKVAPHSFLLYRVVGRRSKFFDVHGISGLQKLMDGAGRAEIDIVAGHTTTFVLRASPKEIMVNGKPSTITQQVINGAYHVTLQQCPPGEQRIALRW